MEKISSEGKKRKKYEKCYSILQKINTKIRQKNFVGKFIRFLCSRKKGFGFFHFFIRLQRSNLVEFSLFDTSKSAIRKNEK